MEGEGKKSVFNGDFFITVIIAGVCVWMLLGSGSFRLLGRLFPQVIAGATLLVCLIQIGIFFRKAKRPAKAKADGEPESKNYLAIVGISVAYLVALPFIGFIISTIALTVIIPNFLGYKRQWIIWTLGLILTLSFYFVFKSIFYVPLPQGVLTFI